MHVEKGRWMWKGDRLERPKANKHSITNAPHVHLNIFVSYHQVVLRGWCDRFGLWVECLRMLVELYCYTIPPVATAEKHSPNRNGRWTHKCTKTFRPTKLKEDVDFCICSSLLFFVCEQGPQGSVVVCIVKSVVKFVHSHSPLLWWWWPVLSADIYFGVGRYSRRMGTQDYLRTQYLKMLNVWTWIHPFMTCLTQILQEAKMTKLLYAINVNR